MTRHAARTGSIAAAPWTLLAPPCAALEMVVVIPVRNEASRLPATLAALAAQTGVDGQPLAPGSSEVIVLANNCTDRSAQIVRRFAMQHPQFSVYVAEVAFPDAVAHVGHARACLMDEACRRLLSVGRTDGIIATTDGDTLVARDWLAATLLEVRNGADAVGGRIEIIDDGSLPAGPARLASRDAIYQRLRCRLEHMLDPNAADPWPRHHQHFGASLAITAGAYLRVGGLPAKPFLEDEALCQALMARDMKLRHSDRVNVVTSSRRHGRVAVGLSWQLREWSALASVDADAQVDDPNRLARDWTLRRELRDCWSAIRIAANGRVHATDVIPPTARIAVMAATLRVPADWLRARVQASETFGRLWLSVESLRRQRPGYVTTPRIPMREAIAMLRSMLAALDDASTGQAAISVDAAADAQFMNAARRVRADSTLHANRSPA